jgi:hypothetical protein
MVNLDFSSFQACNVEDQGGEMKVAVGIGLTVICI